MHVMVVLDAIKKRSHFKDYKKAQKAYVESKQAVEWTKAGPALLDKSAQGRERIARRKPWQKAKEAAKEVKAKTPESKSETKEAGGATKVTEDTM
jgi:hypothetical protein